MRDRRLMPLLILVLVLSSCSGGSTADSTATPAGTSAGSGSTSTAASAPASTPAVSDKAPSVAAPAKAETVTIPAGTAIAVILSDALNSGKNKAGDEFEGSLAAPVYVSGATILDRGTKVHGKVVEAEGSGRVKGLANIRLTLTSVVRNGKTTSIETKSLYAEAEKTTGRDVGVVGGGAGVGAVIGAIAGGKKGAATGAVIGGAAGTGTVLATKGKEVDFPVESKLDFTLDKAVTVTK